jgi:ABC-type oligopeptide transport system substrate-binding subunit
VPLGLPPDPEGIGAPFSGAGPYFIASFERGRRLVALRNPHYRGGRPQHVERIVIDVVDTEAAVPMVERGQADHTPLGPSTATPGGVREQLIAKYGVNRSQYHVVRAPEVFWLALNTERPLFRGNVRLRQALNFAVDRPAVLRTQGPRAGNATDQLLPPTMPGFRNAQIYPLKGPNLMRANALARGRTGSGKAVMYVRDRAPELAAAATIQANLEKIGIVVELKSFPTNVFLARIGTRGEPFDIALAGWIADYADPASFFIPLDGRLIRDRDNFNYSYFHSPSMNRSLDRASRLPVAERYRALGDLDVRMAKNEAPLVPLWHVNRHVFVSKRVGCLLFNAEVMNLGAVCLKR